MSSNGSIHGRSAVQFLVIAGWLLGFYPSASGEPTNTFLAVLNSGQETAVPKPASNALGVAHMTFQENTGMLCYTISFTPLMGVETAAHFHGPAAAGTNASVLFGISGNPAFPSPLGSPKDGCVGPWEGENKSALKSGEVYINVHSTSYPGGEIRGQVLPISGVK